MRLPERGSADIPPRKLREYLLSETHAVGRSKARYLRAFGFDESNTDLLEQGLRAIAQSEEVVESAESMYGTKYVVDGVLATPSGDHIRMRTVWIVDAGRRVPRLVTAYPI